MSRIISAGSIAYSHADFYQPNGSITRLSGIVPANLSLSLFSNSTVLAWPLLDGSNITDSDISSGTVYFEEIVGASGFYLVRFFPDRIGFWRMVLTDQVLLEEVITEYDVVPAGVFKTAPGAGLSASFGL